MHYKDIEVAGGVIAYLVGALLIWFFVIQKGVAEPTDFAFNALGIGWSIFTVASFSFIESRRSAPGALVGWGAFLVVVGAAAGAFGLAFATEAWLKAFLANAFLFPTASAGANFLAQGMVELVRGVGPIPPQSVLTSRATPQRLIEVGFGLLGIGLVLATIFLVIMPTELWQFFGSNLSLLLGGSVGMCFVSQGIIERGRCAQVPPSPAP